MRFLVSSMLTSVLLLSVAAAESLSFDPIPTHIPRKGEFDVAFKYNLTSAQQIVVEVQSQQGVHGFGDVAVSPGEGALTLRVHWTQETQLPKVALKLYAVQREIFQADPSRAWRWHSLATARTVTVGTSTRHLLQQLVIGVDADDPDKEILLDFDTLNEKFKYFSSQQNKFSYEVLHYTTDGADALFKYDALAQVGFAKGFADVGIDFNVNTTDPCLKPYAHYTQAERTLDDLAAIYSPGGIGGPMLGLEQNGNDEATAVEAGIRRNGGKKIISVVQITADEIANFHNDLVSGGVTVNLDKSNPPSNPPNSPFAQITVDSNIAKGTFVLIPIRECRYSVTELAGLGACSLLLLMSMVASGKFVGH